MHVNVIGCGIFAAVSGSSAATLRPSADVAAGADPARLPPAMAIGSLAGAARSAAHPPSS